MLPLLDEVPLWRRVIAGDEFKDPDEHRAVTISIWILANEFVPKLPYSRSALRRQARDSFVDVLLMLLRNVRRWHFRLVNCREQSDVVGLRLFWSSCQISDVMSSVISLGDQLNTATLRQRFGKGDADHGPNATFHVPVGPGRAGPNVAIVVKLDFARVGNSRW